MYLAVFAYTRPPDGKLVLRKHGRRRVEIKRTSRVTGELNCELNTDKTNATYANVYNYKD